MAVDLSKILTIPSQLKHTQGSPVVSLLPDDYLQFMSTFGKGSIEIDGVTAWDLPSPFTAEYLELCETMSRVQNSHRDLDNEESIPFSGLYPEPEGLLPFAENSSGTLLVWDRRGAVNEWQVVMLWIYRAGKPNVNFIEFGVGFTEFWWKFLRREIVVNAYSPWTIDDVSFQPAS